MKDHLFQKGRSGNPAGRPAGSGAIGKLRASIAKHVPEVITKLVEQAKDGDVGAARLLLERAIPALKAVEPIEAVELAGGTLTEQGRSAIAALSDGRLAPAQVAQLMTALAGLAKLIETDDLEKRIKALETKNASDE